MKTIDRLKLIGISILCIAGLAGCDKPGPAESAGKKIDQKVEQAGKTIGAAAEQLGEKIGAQGAKTGAAIDDAEITAKVKAAIFAEPGLKTLQISVDTVNGVVTLTGSVDSQQSSDRAKALAGAVAGVSRVENLLVPKSAGISFILAPNRMSSRINT